MTTIFFLNSLLQNCKNFNADTNSQEVKIVDEKKGKQEKGRDGGMIETHTHVGLQGETEKPSLAKYLKMFNLVTSELSILNLLLFYRFEMILM